MTALPPTTLCAPHPGDSQRFAPLAFFTGSTEGEGRLKIAMHHARTVRVHGAGHMAADGALMLDQRVEQEGKPARQRAWRLCEVAPGRYTGTLSDAAGPVLGQVTGNRLHLRFRIKGGLAADQRLELQPGGQALRNRMTVRKLGIVVATLDETIRKLP